MSLFVATATFGGTPGALSSHATETLELPGAERIERYTSAGFACAVARTRADSSAMYVAHGVAIAGDVRLDGREALRRALRLGAGSAGTSPIHAGVPSAGDLELIVAAYSTWGAAAVERLRGDFSFVLWDGGRGTVLAARDGLGVRPLYFATTATGLCVSNVLSAVRTHDGVGRGLNEPAVLSFLEYGWNRDTTATTFAGISRLAPGGALMLSQTQRQPLVYTHWRMPEPEPLRYTRDGEYEEHYRSLLDEAVRDRLSGDVAIMLSGGLDSTSIAATASRVAHARSVWSLTLRTPQVESMDESRLAAAVAAQAGIANEQRDLRIVALAERTRQTPEPCDEPEAATNQALYADVSTRASVIFSGEDGDGLFAPPGLRSMARTDGLLETIRRVAGYTVRHGHHPYLGIWLADRLRFWRNRDRQVRPNWITAGAAPAADEPSSPPHRSRPEAAARLTSSVWQSIHQRADRAFHGAAVELRWPLLDTRLIEFVLAIPAVPWCQRKQLVRRAFAAELPADVVNRPKMSVPGYLDWLVGEWRQRTGAVCPPLHERTRAYVDHAALATTLANGDTEAVLAAWRALQLDRWLRVEDAA